jgi:hypothetical protein
LQKTKFIKMKKSIVLLVFAISFAVTGCKKQDATEENKEPAAEVVLDKSFNVILDVTIKHDDDIALYYTTDGSVDFTKIQPIWQGVKGSELAQQVTYKLPEGVKPTEFRIDFGLKPNKEDMYFKKITFKYLGKERAIACPEMVEFFRANDTYCTFDAATGLLRGKVVDGKLSSPSVYPHETKLTPELEKLY